MGCQDDNFDGVRWAVVAYPLYPTKIIITTTRNPSIKHNLLDISTIALDWKSKRIDWFLSGRSLEQPQIDG